jgi:hypothetical protein
MRLISPPALIAGRYQWRDSVGNLPARLQASIVEGRRGPAQSLR